MWEFFWFIQGAVVYKLLSFFFNLGKKLTFIDDIRIVSFQLIGRAYGDLVFLRSLKYKAMLKEGDEEKIKIHRNEDEQFIELWKKNTIIKLNSSVPFPYQTALEIEDWKALMELLDTYYKSNPEVRHDAKKQKD